MRYTKDESDAVEVLNTGFLKVFNNISKFDDSKASLYTWISTIVVNSCLDFVKSKATRPQYSTLDGNIEVEIPAEVVSKIRTHELLKLVRSLPPATQAVFNLYALEGYQHKDISKLLGISEGTSKWHLSEAKKSLQQMLQNQKVQTHG
jgi:RNA polymerase sigma factor (sigma-70 family)